MPTPIKKIKPKAIASLCKALEEMFDRADDTLFQMADRAGSNSEQNTFFESMREVRVKRRGVEKSFREELEYHFSLLPEESDHPEIDDITFETLSLVQNDDLEESVAVESMVSKFRNKNGSELRSLNARFDSLIASIRINECNNPLDPAQVCAAFISAIDHFKLDISGKLIIYKLFDKHVLAALGDVLAAANRELIDMGVLPDLRIHTQEQKPLLRAAQGGAEQSFDSTKREFESGASSSAGFSQSQTRSWYETPTPSADESAPQAEEAQTSGGRNDIFTMLQMLLTRERGLPSTYVGPVVEQHELIGALSNLQRAVVSRGLDKLSSGGSANATGHSAFSIREALVSLLNEAYASKTIEKNDDDTINLVAMLFEFILGDENLPESIKLTISRLQIPILKVAILDKDFFAKSTHPARRLLNELAKAGIGVSDQTEMARDKIRKEIERVVQVICEEFDDDLQLFEDLNANFITFIEQESRRAELIEKRTADAEQGRAKTEQARFKVDQIIQQHIEGKDIPGLVVELLKKAWSNVLFLIYVKEGEGSPQWENALTTMKELIWSVEFHDEADTPRKLMAMVPNLLENLREHLTRVSFNHFDMGNLFDELEKIHLARIRGEKLPDSTLSANDVSVLFPEQGKDKKGSERRGTTNATEATQEQIMAAMNAVKSTPPVKPKTDVSVSKPLEKASIVEESPAPVQKANTTTTVIDKNEEDGVDQLVDAVSKDVAHFSEKSKTVKADEKQAEDNNLSMSERAKHRGEEIAAFLNKQANIQQDVGGELEPLTDEDEHMSIANRLKTGSWVEFVDPEGGAAFRCKLAARIEVMSKLIFVNRMGIKVSEKTILELAYALKSGQARLIDESLLFDRALESMIGDLRNKPPTQR